MKELWLGLIIFVHDGLEPCDNNSADNLVYEVAAAHWAELLNILWCLDLGDESNYSLVNLIGNGSS